MGDFTEQTAVEPVGDGHFRADLSDDWMLWGPAGGYVSAIALRAAGAATRFERPVSFACQYLSVARFEPVDLHVTSLRAGSRTEALRVDMSQEGRAILSAQVWAAGDNEGMQHDHVPVPEVPGPDGLVEMNQLRSGDRHPYFDNMEWRPVAPREKGDLEPREPQVDGWFRFRPTAGSECAFADAARAVVLIDTFTWPATWDLYPGGPSPWIAPNLDLYVRFHRDTRPHAWLMNRGRADLAEGGLIAASGAVWSPDRELLATGATQLYCRPRPERFK